MSDTATKTTHSLLHLVPTIALMIPGAIESKIIEPAWDANDQDIISIFSHTFYRTEIESIVLFAQVHSLSFTIDFNYAVEQTEIRLFRL